MRATGGLGAGSRAHVGRAAAEEVIDEIRNHLAGAHMVFVTAGKLCCNPKTKLLARAMMTDAKQAAYLFGFQQDVLRAEMTTEVRARFDAVLQPIITENFAQSPSAMPALLAMTGDAYANLAANDLRVR